MPKLSLAKPERHLYSAADRLRQEGLDAATCKDYIFGMLFLKRRSDVWQAEHDALVVEKVAAGVPLYRAEKDYGEDPNFYDSFFVPERARWDYLLQRLSDATEPYGSILDKALAALKAITTIRCCSVRARPHSVHAESEQQAHCFRRRLQGSRPPFQPV